MSVEEFKKESRLLRGTIKETLKSDAIQFEEAEKQLLKFHGVYQEDDRDRRVERKKKKLDRYYIFMVRSKIPGGTLTADQYLTHDRVADEFGNGMMRITSRQGLQMHFVIKDELKECIARINESGITTWGACGDVVRNVMASPWPFKSHVYEDVQLLSQELKDAFTASSNAYTEIWLDGEKLELTGNNEDEPLYGDTYLPRKFKIGIAVPPRNDVDIYTHDLGLVPSYNVDKVTGYTILVGGGFGMSHAKKNTYPRLSDPFCFVKRNDVIEVCKAIIETQRDCGNRGDRKQARLKYLIDQKGLDWLMKQVQSRVSPTLKIMKPKPVQWETVSDYYGWQKQGDGKWFVTIWIPEGRIKDLEHERYKTALKNIALKTQCPIRFTPNCNIVFYNIDSKQKRLINAILEKHNIPTDKEISIIKRYGMACVALPTCGLALAESERVFQDVLDKIQIEIDSLKLHKEPILIRMTGCPNGCARPYNADFAFVGKSPDTYVMYVGGSHRGDRLARLEQKMIKTEEIPSVVRTYLQAYKSNRLKNETFSDYWKRTHPESGTVDIEQFHVEPE
jgi:sulfite reductase (ferredoxin)